MASSVTARSGTSNRSRSGERFQVLALDVGAFREGEMQGNGRVRLAHLDPTRWFCSSNPTCSIR